MLIFCHFMRKKNAGKLFFWKELNWSWKANEKDSEKQLNGCFNDGWNNKTAEWQWNKTIVFERQWNGFLLNKIISKNDFDQIESISIEFHWCALTIWVTKMIVNWNINKNINENAISSLYHVCTNQKIRSMKTPMIADWHSIR